MVSPRPDDWLEVTLARMEATELRHSNERRVQIADLISKFDIHAEDDRRVEKRVTAIESEAAFKKESARKDAALTSLFIAGLITAGWEAIRHLIGWSK